ncbi:OmpH family outer membrane protein, partial [bacterium]|nr:OmpH family outer membrane protein [bacterium]
MNRLAKFCFTILVAMMTLTGMASTAFADNIGFVDLEKVFSRYKEAVKLQQDIQKRREGYQKLFEEKNKKLDEIKKKSKKEDDIQKFIQKTESELKPKQEELIKYEAEANRKMAATIFEVSETVAKQFGIDVVLDKRAILAGGFDLTDSV